MGLQDDIWAQDMIFAADPDLTPGCEAVTLKFIDGSTRSVNAHVRRFPFVEGERSGQLDIYIGLVLDETLGLLVSEANPQGTKVSLPVKHGESAVWLTLHEIQTADRFDTPTDPGMGWWKVM